MASADRATTRKPPEQVFPSRDAAVFAFHNHRDIFGLMEWSPQWRITSCSIELPVTCSSSGRGITTCSTFSPLKSSSWVAFFLRVCSRITVSSSSKEGSCSISASSKRFCCPGMSSDLFSLDEPKSFLVR